LHNLTRDDLYQHYKTYYGPHNAVLIIVGDINVDQVRARIDELFGPIPAGPPPPPVLAKEPPQQSERRVTMRQPGTTAYFYAVYQACAGSHPDSFPLVMLESILSGASLGGTPTHRSARLYRALVETEIATQAGASYRPSIDPGTIHFSGTIRDGRTLAEFETILNAEIERICREPVREDELAKVRKQVRAQFAYTIERVSNQAYWLGWQEMLGDWHRFSTFVDNLSAVTAEDVQRVAQTYLKPANRTTGWFEPTVET
jgi:zinc protease